MAHKPDLYGQRAAAAAKKQTKKATLELSDTLGFAAHMQSLIASKPRGSGSGSVESSDAKKRSGKPLFASASAKKSKMHVADGRMKSTAARADAASAKLGVAERERVRAALTAKARRYDLLQRGDDVGHGVPGQSLVDFDRKWAEVRERGDDTGDDSEDNNSADDSGGDSDDDSKDDSNSHAALKSEMVEYTDEFGRTRTVSKAQHERTQRRQERAARAAQELEEMRARPAPPPDASLLLYGDVIQTKAVEVAPQRPENGDAEDSSHYRASDDVRTRGAAFYAFADGDETLRTEQMQALADERKRTEAAREERSTQLDLRRQAVAARKAELAARRAQKQAESFLSGLGQKLDAVEK